jgi:hypothetical protein
VSATHIDVIPESGATYRVTVSDADGSTTHLVGADPGDIEHFGAGVPAEELIEASFRFLLDREPKEAILGRFDLPVIARYFPDYPNRIQEYLR